MSVYQLPLVARHGFRRWDETWVRPQEGYYDVVVHGSSVDFGATPYDWEQGLNFDHRQLADMIQHDPNYQGGPIRLLSCSTGQLSDGAAQGLANQLGVDVLAPSDTLWAFEDGRYSIGDLPGVNTGEFELFRPGNVNTLGGD